MTPHALFGALRLRAQTRATAARSARVGVGGRRGGRVHDCRACARAQAGPPDKYAECLPAGAATDCQFGLTLAHRNVWQAIARAKQGAAWVFECAPAQHARANAGSPQGCELHRSAGLPGAYRMPLVGGRLRPCTAPLQMHARHRAATRAGLQDDLVRDGVWRRHCAPMHADHPCASPLSASSAGWTMSGCAASRWHVVEHACVGSDGAAEAGRRARRDDFVLHDDFLSLFPQYWASVPLGFDYVVVGQIPRHFDTGNYTVQGAAQLHSALEHERRQPR